MKTKIRRELLNWIIIKVLKRKLRENEIHWIRKKLRLESFQLSLFIVLLETIKVINFKKGEKLFLYITKKRICSMFIYLDCIF